MKEYQDYDFTNTYAKETTTRNNVMTLLYHGKCVYTTRTAPTIHTLTHIFVTTLCLHFTFVYLIPHYWFDNL